MVRPPLHAERPGHDPLKEAPEVHAVEERVEVVRHDAVVRVLPVPVVVRVVGRRLEHAVALQGRDEPAVLGPGAVRPLVELVGVDADQDDEPGHP